MPEKTVPATHLGAWKSLKAHFEKIAPKHLRQFFAEDPQRGERLALDAMGLYFDYSKHRVSDETLALLLKLAEEAGLRGRIDAMFRGDKINLTEDRAVLHIALRSPKSAKILVDGKDVIPDVHAVLNKMAVFADKVRAKAVTAGGESGDPASPHFNDQAKRYATGDFREVYFYKSQLQGHTQREYHPGN